MLQSAAGASIEGDACAFCPMEHVDQGSEHDSTGSLPWPSTNAYLPTMNLPPATRKVPDFENCGMDVVDPFESVL